MVTLPPAAVAAPGTQPPTVACIAVEAQWKRVCIAYMFLARLAPIRTLSRVLSNKISASELSRKFIKSALLVGYHYLYVRITHRLRTMGIDSCSLERIPLGWARAARPFPPPRRRTRRRRRTMPPWSRPCPRCRRRRPPRTRTGGPAGGCAESSQE